MSGTSAARCNINIKDTALKHKAILGYLMPAHVLTGCDTVSYIWGIGNATVLSVLKGEYTLSKLGCLQEQMSDVNAESSRFIAAFYGYPDAADMSQLR